MDIPRDSKEANRLRLALKSLAHDESFKVFVAWLESELEKRDEENRLIGKENKTSAAYALALILNHIAACKTSTADDDQTRVTVDE